MIDTDVIQYASLNMPIDDVSVSGGAIDVAVVIDDASIGEFIPTHTIDPALSTTWYYKLFKKNTHGADTWSDVRFYVENLLIQVVAGGTVSLVSSSSSDDSDYRGKIIGEDNGGNETEENVTMGGTSSVYSVNSFDKVHRVEFRSSTTPYALVAPTGIVTVTRGIQLGVLPSGCNGAWGEIEIALDPDKDDNIQVATRLDAPDDGGATPLSLTFYRANTYATSLLCTGAGGDLPSGSAQGVWVKLTTEAGAKPSLDMPLWVVGYGTST